MSNTLTLPTEVLSAIAELCAGLAMTISTIAPKTEGKNPLTGITLETVCKEVGKHRVIQLIENARAWELYAPSNLTLTEFRLVQGVAYAYGLSVHEVNNGR